MTTKSEELLRSWELEPNEIEVRFFPNPSKIKVYDPSSVHEFMLQHISKTEFYLQESLWLITMNNANYITGFKKISMGCLTSTVVPINLILAIVLKSCNSSFIVVHNHPSGEFIPSKADKEITNNINAAANTVSLNFLDHVIITEFGFYSFATEGLK